MHKFLSIAVIFLSCNLLFSQVDATIPVSSAEKYNKRGFFNNEDINVEEHEMISDYDGNLLINYSTHLALPDDLEGDFSITYNANVEHRLFEYLNNSSIDGGYSINHPEWIMGYKGFAIQTLNFETNFFLSENNCGTNPLDWSRSEVPLLIPGYHYSNQILQPGEFDNITILLADGSKKTLQNTQTSQFNGSPEDPLNGYVGLYTELGNENYGFAIVHALYLNATDANKFLRKMWYKPGDGLTYYFEEVYADYAPLSNPTWNINKNNSFPKIMYLKKIINPDGCYISFHYSDSPHLGINNHNGRLLFTHLETGYKNVFHPAEQEDFLRNGKDLELFYGYDGSNMLNIVVDNNISKEKFTIIPKEYTCITPDGLDCPVPCNPPTSWTLFGIERDERRSRILGIQKIINNFNQADEFQYNSQYRLFMYGDNIWINHFMPACSTIQYCTGKMTELLYYDKTFSNNGLSEPFHPYVYLDKDEENGGIYVLQNMTEALRDCFTNLMIYKRRIYNKYDGNSIAKFEEEYKYSGGDDPKALRSERIKTEIIKTDLSGQNSPQISEKFYTRYKVDAPDLNFADKTYDIKLVEEKVIDVLKSRTRIYYYNLGNFDNVSQSHNGTFLLDSIGTIETDGAITVSRSEHFNYNN
ncbi:MAG: hypothetical protein R6W90_06100, partial [Ignavibacteriaceae bacterium]